ncbi:MAG: DUF1501 domain-containing protein [Planctomycetaceae bacterium]|nr:DUF1501 domain-containing protein [Planctomycetaceae bacterium]
MTSPSPFGMAPALSRRTMLNVGTIGMMGLGLPQLAALESAASATPTASKKSVIFVFINGGLSHQDTFDMKPQAPDSVRGEFQPIHTQTPGIQICEHLPMMAARTDKYAIVRSLSTDSSDHGPACHMLFTGRLDFPAGFVDQGKISSNEWPSLLSQITYMMANGEILPPAAVLPQPSINEANAVRPGQYAGKLGNRWESWHIDIAAPCALGNGACPHCFRFNGEVFEHGSPSVLNMPMLSLPDGGRSRFMNRIELLSHVERQQQLMEKIAMTNRLDRDRQQAISVLADAKVRSAFDVENADQELQQRYGRNKFGLSLLMARRLVEAGVRLVQVNLGKNSSWDTHVGNFVNLRNNLLPFADRALSALLDDLDESGMLESTLVIISGEFGRTPAINKDAGRDHWGPAMSGLFAGGGVRGGQVIGATDDIAAWPVSDRYTPENIAATIFHTLGIDERRSWHDIDGRPHELYRAQPIAGLF